MDSVYFSTGFKMGEITDSSAIISTRLCKTAKPVVMYHQQKKTIFRPPLDFDNNMPVHEMDVAVEGSSGQVKISLSTKDTIITTNWIYLSAYKDFTIKRKFEELIPNTTYSILIQGQKAEGLPVTKVERTFTTAPS